MAEVILTNRARSDLEEIWRRIATDDPAAAERVLRRLKSKLTALTAFPDLGSPRPDIQPGARVLVEAPYLVLYWHDEHGVVTVIAIVHGARDLKSIV